jgi:hypothetical protein
LLLLLLFVMCHSFGSGMNKRGETKFMIWDWKRRTAKRMQYFIASSSENKKKEFLPRLFIFFIAATGKLNYQHKKSQCNGWRKGRRKIEEGGEMNKQKINCHILFASMELCESAKKSSSRNGTTQPMKNRRIDWNVI